MKMLDKIQSTLRKKKKKNYFISFLIPAFQGELDSYSTKKKKKSKMVVERNIFKR